MPAIHLIIKGKVQGVYFRAEAERQARSHNLAGWVRNTEDGHVELMAGGEETALAEFEQWCHHGPARAEVNSIEKKEVELPLSTPFRIRR